MDSPLSLDITEAGYVESNHVGKARRVCDDFGYRVIRRTGVRGSAVIPPGSVDRVVLVVHGHTLARIRRLLRSLRPWPDDPEHLGPQQGRGTVPAPPNGQRCRPLRPQAISGIVTAKAQALVAISHRFQLRAALLSDSRTSNRLRGHGQ